jgi:hypothetical protein
MTLKVRQFGVIGGCVTSAGIFLDEGEPRLISGRGVGKESGF